MHRFLAARVSSVAACVLFVLSCLALPAGAQVWNDPRGRALVEGATQRRAEQLADTALRDYQAVAHGYVAFLAQLGEGFRTPPKVIKTDELEDEVYWRAPNLSKQRIVGRRDTLLLPTDIAYHTDHLGIVQNNFPDIIRIGDGGDEVADVPHPLSRRGLMEYDFALTDSFAIGSASNRIQVYEIKVRPKDDRQPRVVGAVYIDQASRQVVRMNFTFTRAAFLDKALEDLSIVLENRLVGGRFWLPSRQEIEIRRKGEWLNYPARGIIRGRWEIGDYQFNQNLAPLIFTGAEIVVVAPQILAQHKWQGNILDSLPPDVRAISEPDIERVREEARALVRAQALSTARQATLYGRSVHDFAHFNRVEGFAFGAGAQKQLGAGWSASVRARYGLDDKQAKGAVEIAHQASNGSAFRLFAQRDFRDVGDVQERSSVINSIAAQEFGSDYTDPYLVRGVGAGYEVPAPFGATARLSVAFERHTPLQINATPITGTFPSLSFVPDERVYRAAFDLERPASVWLNGFELAWRGEFRVQLPATGPDDVLNRAPHSVRGFASVNLEKPFGAHRLVTSLTGAATDRRTADEAERVLLGGPISAPGYGYHSLVSSAAATGHIEWRVPAPFPSFSLGRYGRVPSRGTFAPYLHVAALSDQPIECTAIPATAPRPVLACETMSRFAPSVGAAYVFPFDLLRVEVAKGLARQGRWMFYVDVTREFWSIL